MKILGIIGIESKRKDMWNGEIIRTGGVGVSGTDQSFVLLFEYLALAGHEVYLSFYQCKKNTIYKGVNYVDSIDLSKLTNIIDVLIIPSWYNEFINYTYNNLKKLVVWCHYQGFINEYILHIFKTQYPNTKIYVNFLSQFVKLYLDKYYDYYSEYIDNIFSINNPLMFDQAISNCEKVSKSFIFFGSFERGGKISINVFNNLPYSNKSMNICSYDFSDIHNNNIQNIKVLDKLKLFTLLSRTEYFIYPLVLPLERQSIIHKDTDGCVVAESLLHEVIVLTYPVGALKEKYGDHLVYLPYPPGVDINLLEGPDQVSAPQFHSEFVIDSIVKIIEFLENNPQLKEVLKKRGKDYIFKKRDPSFIKSEWLNNLGLNN